MRLILLNLILAITSSLIAFYMVLTRKDAKIQLTALILTGASIWSYGYAFEMFYPRLETKLFWASFQFIGMAITNILPLFIAYYFGLDEWLTMRNIGLMAITPLTFLGLAATNDYHHLVLVDASINLYQSHYPLIKIYGPAAYIFFVYSYIVIGSCVIYSMIKAKTMVEDNWKILSGLISAMIIPILFNINSHIPTNIQNIDYTSAAYNVVAIGLALFTPSELNVGNMFPFEYSSILNGMQECLVITDRNQKIRYVNPSAKKVLSGLFGVDLNSIIGRSLKKVIQLNQFGELNELTVDGVQYDTSSFELLDWLGRNRSKCYILRDVSERVSLENKLKILHKYGSEIAKVSTYEEVGTITLSALSNRLGFKHGVLYIFEESRPVFVKHWGMDKEKGEVIESNIETPKKILKIINPSIYSSTDDFLNQIDYETPSVFRDFAMSHVPLIVDEKVSGALALFRPQTEGFTQENLRLLEIFGGHVASSLHTIKNEEQIHEIQEKEIKKILEGAGRVSNMVRHDLRGPLQTIRNAGYMIKRKPDNIEKMIQIIDNSAKYVVQILEDLQYQDQTGSYDKIKMNLNTLTNQTLNQMIVPDNIVIEKKLYPDPIDHMLDKIKIQRMLNNLFKNAFEAMPNGGTLTISTKKCVHGTTVMIQDTGIGVEDLDLLFTPFHTTKINGMGLGLISVKQTIENHGGTIEVESEKGVGTKFIIRIPENPDQKGTNETRLSNMITT